MSKAKNKRPIIDAENPEWTAADMKRAKPLSELVPANIAAQFKKHRGPQKEPKKVPVSLRLSPAVLEHFKATGPGWQTRIDKALGEIVFRRFRRAKAQPLTPTSPRTDKRKTA